MVKLIKFNNASSHNSYRLVIMSKFSEKIVHDYTTANIRLGISSAVFSNKNCESARDLVVETLEESKYEYRYRY